MPKSKLQNVLQNYFPLMTDFEYITLNSGHINTTYKVEISLPFEKKEVVLQRLNTKIFTEPQRINQNIQKVNAFLKKSDYRLRISELLENNLQQDFFIQDDEFWRVMDYIPNTFTLEKCENPAQAFCAAQSFGHFMACLSALQVVEIQTIIPNFHNAAMRWEQFGEAEKNAKNTRLKVAQKEIAFAKNNYDLIAFYEKIINEIPQRLTHNDTKISNILFDKTTNQPLAIIDLDTLQVGTVLAEFGDMVRSYCSTASEDEQNLDKINFRHDIFEALKKGFLSEIGEQLTTTEKELLDFGAKLTIFVQGLRFLSDHLNNDIYYKIKFANHNLIRAKNQFELLTKWQTQKKTQVLLLDRKYDGFA